jgi:peroxiredoxin
MRSDIAPGGTFPDYELPDHENVPRKLSEIQGDDPLILTLARGNYCPKEHQQHLELAANYPKIAVAYTKIATISTDTHHSSQEFRASTGAQWPFLSDPERTVQEDLDIQEYTDPERDPMIPHTLVLKPPLVIHSIYNGYCVLGTTLLRGSLARPTPILIRNLKGKPPMSNLFGKTGRQWLAELQLSDDERDAINAGLRQVDFLSGEIGTLDRPGRSLRA